MEFPFHFPSLEDPVQKILEYMLPFSAVYYRHEAMTMSCDLCVPKVPHVHLRLHECLQDK